MKIYKLEIVERFIPKPMKARSPRCIHRRETVWPWS